MSTIEPTTKYDVDLGHLGAKLAISTAENEAGIAIVEHTLPPHTLAAPLHRHSREDEISYVIEGEMTVLADEELSTIGADELVVKARDVWHTFWNAGDEELRFLEIMAPGDFSGFFEEIAPIYPFEPTDEAAIAEFEQISAKYGFEGKLESVPELCEKYDLQL